MDSPLISNATTLTSALTFLENVHQDATTDQLSLHARTMQKLTSSVKHIAPQVPRQRVKRQVPKFSAELPDERITTRARVVAERLGILDPLFPKQWHLINDERPAFMINATSVWDMGITGQGVISALVDDGLDYRSDDIAQNFVSGS